MELLFIGIGLIGIALFFAGIVAYFSTSNKNYLLYILAGILLIVLSGGFKLVIGSNEIKIKESDLNYVTCDKNVFELKNEEVKFFEEGKWSRLTFELKDGHKIITSVNVCSIHSKRMK